GLIEQERSGLQRAAERADGDDDREQRAHGAAPRNLRCLELEPRDAALFLAAIFSAWAHQLHLTCDGSSRSPRMRTSSSRRTPNWISTSLRTRSMSPSMSAAVAPPVFKMKFACFSETTAPPMRSPFMPASSTSPPA